MGWLNRGSMLKYAKCVLRIKVSCPYCQNRTNENSVFIQNCFPLIAFKLVNDGLLSLSLSRETPWSLTIERKNFRRADIFKLLER